MAQVVIQSVMATGDLLTISGTVDGQPVTASGWKSALTGKAVADQAYLAGQLKAMIPASPVSLPGYTGMMVSM